MPASPFEVSPLPLSASSSIRSHLSASRGVSPAVVSSCLTPLGEFHVAAGESAIVASGSGTIEEFLLELGETGHEVEDIVPSDRLEPGILSDAVRQIEEYFEGRRTDFDLPVAYGRRSPFALRVLEEVRLRVPFACTATYQEIGERAGSPRSGRAVGNIMACCPHSVIVPCHRIIHTGGGIGDFSRSNRAEGTRRKGWLLRFERDTAAAASSSASLDDLPVDLELRLVL